MARGIQRRFAKKLDNLRWEKSSGFFNSVPAGSAGINFLTVASLPCTLMRMRGQVLSGIQGTAAPGIGLIVTMGIIKVPEGTGTTVLWDPFTDGNAPWIWFEQIPLYYEEYVTDVISGDQMQSRSVIDNKAMRKIRPDEELQMVMTNTTQDGAGTVNVQFGIRTLIGF